METIDRRTAIDLLLGFGLSAIGTSYLGPVVASETESRQVDSDELQKRAKELSAALQRTYQERAPGLGGRGTDITEAVQPYIPIGTSFRDAETILRNAGFTVVRPNLSEPKNPKVDENWQAVRAEIAPFVQGSFFRVTAFVWLFPKSPGDYTSVAKLSAIFVKVTL